MHVRALLSLLLVLVLAISPAAAAESSQACSFTETEKAQVEAAMSRLDRASLLPNFSAVSSLDGNEFNPYMAGLTRAAATTILVKALGRMEEAKQISESAPFPDVQEHPWAAPYISLAWQEGIVKGDPGGNFRPDHWITIEEFQVMLARLLRLPGEITLESAASVLQEGGVDTSLPCPRSGQAIMAHMWLLLDRTLATPIYARHPSP